MASKYETSEFRNGLKVEIDGQPYIMTYFQFVKPGKGTAFTRTKLKNMITGSVIERTYRSGEKLDAADVEDRPMQYLYGDGEFFHFMNTETFNQVAIPADAMQEEAPYLTDGIEVTILFYKDRAVNMELPNFIEDDIEYCEPGVKGNTATGATKLATLACGAQVQVPLFVEQGERIKVDTRTNSYVSRVK
ncbi:MAG: elongation factor P [Alphaproteobacteria bacterium]|nr:elongation factor P [Alphaproteobacteria bacterium]